MISNKKALSGNLFAMIFAFILIVIILVIFLFFASIYQPFKKTDREFAILQSQNMAYQSLKNYLGTEVSINSEKLTVQQLIDRWAFDQAYETQLKQETENIFSPVFRNCYELRIPYFNGQPYFISGVNEANYFSVGTPNNENYVEIITPSKLAGENRVILVRLALDNKCLGIEK